MSIADSTLRARIVSEMWRSHHKGFTIISVDALAALVTTETDQARASTLISQLGHENDAPIELTLDQEAVQLAGEPNEIEGWVVDWIEKTDPQQMPGDLR